MDTSVTPDIYPAYMNEYERTLCFREQLKAVGYVPLPGEPKLYVKAHVPSDVDLFSLPISEACDLFTQKKYITSWASKRGGTNKGFVLEFSRYALETLNPIIVPAPNVKEDNGNTYTMMNESTAEDYLTKFWIPKDKLLASKVVQRVFDIVTDKPIVFLQYMTHVKLMQPKKKTFTKNEFAAVKPILFGVYDFSEFVFTKFGVLIAIESNERYKEIFKLPGETQKILLSTHGTDSLKVVSAHPMAVDELIFKLKPENYEEVLAEYGFRIYGDPQSYLMQVAKLYEPVLTREIRSYNYDDTNVSTVMLGLQNLTDEEIIHHFGVGFKFQGRMNLFSEIYLYSHNETFLFPEGKIAFGVIGTKPFHDKATIVYEDYSIEELRRLIDIYRTFDPVPLEKIIEIEYTIINPKKDELSFKIDDPTLFEKLYWYGATSDPKYLKDAKEAAVSLNDNRVMELRTLFYDPVSNGYLYALTSIKDVLRGAWVNSYDLMLTAYVMARQLADTKIA